MDKSLDGFFAKPTPEEGARVRKMLSSALPRALSMLVERREDGKLGFSTSYLVVGGIPCEIRWTNFSGPSIRATVRFLDNQVLIVRLPYPKV